MRAPAFLAVAALAAAPLAARQQAPEQFKSATELVSVYTTVQEKNGRLVPDLRKEDFSSPTTARNSRSRSSPMKPRRSRRW